MFINSLVIFCSHYKSDFYHLLEGASGNDPPFGPDYLCTLIFKLEKEYLYKDIDSNRNTAAAIKLIPINCSPLTVTPSPSPAK